MVGFEPQPDAPASAQDARLADRLNAPWYAVYIQTPVEDLTRIDAATQRLLSKNLDLAQQLGGFPMTFRARTSPARSWPSPANTRSRSSSSARAAALVSQLLKSSILDQLERTAEGFDIMIADV